MTLTELKYIVILAQEQHFGRAAAQCLVSQPTLSIAVKKLEDELGILLFERTKICIKPTILGEQILQRARKILAQAAEIQDLANSDQDQLNGPLNIGTLPTIGAYLIPQLISLLQKTARNMPLNIDEAQAPDLAKKLRHGELDVILATKPFQEPDLVTQVLYDEPFVVLLPAQHPLASQLTIDANDIPLNELLLMAHGHCLREQLLTAFPRLREIQNTQVNRLPQSQSLETLRHMTASGLGITILPLSATGASLYSQNILVTRPIKNPSPYRTLILAWRSSYPRHKALDLLRNAILTTSPGYWNYTTANDAHTSTIAMENRQW
jgi:LysR family transcriptional regulator, hydrogen peroxide-inducible genes activator